MPLPRAHRLPAKAFRETLSQGKTAKGSFFFVKARVVPGNLVRIGMRIPARVVPRAVDRSRLRRIISREIEAVVKKRDVGYDVVIAITKKEAPNGAVERTLSRILYG